LALTKEIFVGRNLDHLADFGDTFHKYDRTKSQAIHLELEVSNDLALLQLPEGVQHRLTELAPN
jgi:hypothetical protein